MTTTSDHRETLSFAALTAAILLTYFWFFSQVLSFMS